MDIKKWVLMAVSVITAAVVFGACLPVFADTTQTTDTFTNEGYYHMTKYDTTQDVNISWDHDTPKKITVNGVEYNISFVFNQWYSLVVADNWYFRYADGNTTQYVQNSYGGIDYVSASTSNGTDITLECTGGTATIKSYNGDTVTNTKTANYTELYVISGDTGSYVMKYSNNDVYMAEDSEFIALGTTALGESARAVIRIDGSIEDGATVNIIASTPEGATVTDNTISVNTTDCNNYNGYMLSDITFKITSNGTDYNATYSYFIVPYEVTLERAIHPEGATLTLMGLLPVLIAMGLLLGVVGAVIVRKL